MKQWNLQPEYSSHPEEESTPDETSLLLNPASMANLYKEIERLNRLSSFISLHQLDQIVSLI